MPYQLPLSSFSLSKYRDLLKKQNLLPGRRILWQDINHNFEVLLSLGITDVGQLFKSLSTKEKLSSIASKTDISVEYLTILKREIGSLLQKPVSLSAFTGIDTSIIENLQKQGIHNSKALYESEFFGDDELSCLCDLVRINGVGAVAAKVFFNAGYHSVQSIATADAKQLLSRITAVNEKQHYYKAKLGIQDMQFCIDFAKLLVSYA